jgi:hypothetical protein
MEVVDNAPETRAHRRVPWRAIHPKGGMPTSRHLRDQIIAPLAPDAVVPLWGIASIASGADAPQAARSPSSGSMALCSSVDQGFQDPHESGQLVHADLRHQSHQFPTQPFGSARLRRKLKQLVQLHLQALR